MIYLKEYFSNIPNARLSLFKSVMINSLIQKISDIELINKLIIFKQYDNLFFWDFGIKVSLYLEIEDWTLIVIHDFIFYGRIDYMIPDETGELGDAIGWARQYKNPWKNIVVYKSLINNRITPEKIIRINSIKRKSKCKYNTNNFYQIPDHILLEILLFT